MNDQPTTDQPFAVPQAPSAPMSQNPLLAVPMAAAAEPAASTSVGHHTAQDADLIEAEWVKIVKRVLSQHKNDPYNQSHAMTLLREDYMKKRYGRVIKEDEA